MASYAALLSLMFTIEQIENHPRPPVSLSQKQVESLTQNVAFFQNFLELYSTTGGSNEDGDLEGRIADAAYAAEDVIETHIVDQIHGGSNSCLSSVDLYEGLQGVIECMDLLKKEVMVIIEEKMGSATHQQLHRNSEVSTVSGGQSSAMADFGDILYEILEKLTGPPYDLQIIQIVGMGGTGKTTLARNIYANPLIVQHFDILAWVTISQEYSRAGILRFLCQELGITTNDLSEDELGVSLHKHLWGRRCLILMDDVWSIEAVDIVKSFFPDNNNASRIMITTRLSNLASDLSGSHSFRMKFLDVDQSWDLLCRIVFGKQVCPIELENIGKEIARNCRGLLLSLAVIGGLLTKSTMTREYWEYILENLTSLINLENNEHCLQVLRTSYVELPIHLKPCFLYMAVFPEDDEIYMEDLVTLWVAEGILRSFDGRSLEETGREAVKELTFRNLILVHELDPHGNASICKIHDLLRDFCLKEAQKQKFLHQGLNIPQGTKVRRCFFVHNDTPEEDCPQIFQICPTSQFQICLTSESASFTRSLLMIKRSDKPLASFTSRMLPRRSRMLTSRMLPRRSRMLRVYKHSMVGGCYYLQNAEAIFQKADVQYLYIGLNRHYYSKFPSSRAHLWNIQTLDMQPLLAEHIFDPSQIWEMPLLRHANLDGYELPDPDDNNDIFVLENLHTLSNIGNFKCSKQVVRRIPNIERLESHYTRHEKERGPDFCLHNLHHLHKLNSLALFDIMGPISGSEIFRNLTFPRSLTDLTLYRTKLYWDALTTKIGVLPRLAILVLSDCACIGGNWETDEGQFCSLRFLHIDGCVDLKYWTTDSTHFPRMEHLILNFLPILEEVPSCIGDIPTLKSIRLEICSESAADSARRIKEEQEYNGNGDLDVQIGPIFRPRNFRGTPDP